MLALVNWGGTFDSATAGTFQSDTGGTFHSDTPGTFESDMDGTFKVSQSTHPTMAYRIALLRYLYSREHPYNSKESLPHPVRIHKPMLPVRGRRIPIFVEADYQ